MRNWIRTKAASVVAAILIGIHAALTWWSRPGRVGIGGDDAFYLWLARALRQGTYREIHRFDQPIHSQYPPGYPALLALGGDYTQTTDLAIAIGVVAAALTLCLLYDLARRLTDKRWALVALALASFNSLTIARNTGVFAEATFTALATLAVWCAVRRPETTWSVLGSAAAALAAVLVRQVGITIVAAILVAWIWDRRYRRALVGVVSSARIFGPWVAWSFLAPRPAIDRSYVQQIAYAVSTERYVPLRSFFKAAKGFVTKGFAVLMHTPTVGGTILDNLYWSSLILLLLVIGLVISARVARPIGLTFVCYMLLVAVWPYHPVRFLLPLIPVMLVLLCLGAKRLVEIPRLRWTVALLALSALAILGFEIREDVRLVRHGTTCRAGDLTRCYHDRAAAFFEMASWAKANLPPDAVVATVKEATFAYYADRKVVSQGWLVTYHNTGLLKWMAEHGIRYVLVSALNPSPLPKRLKSVCEWLEPVHQVPPSAFMLRIVNKELPSDRSACSVLENFGPNGRLRDDPAPTAAADPDHLER
jgi:hypothetical protein